MHSSTKVADFMQNESSIRVQATTKTKSGSFTITGVFLHAQKARTPTPGKKEPPRKVEIMLIDVDTMREHDPNGAYQIKEDHILAGYYDKAAITNAKKEMEKTPNETTIAALAVAEEPRAWATLRNGTTMVISTFAKGQLDQFKYPQFVQCLGVKGDYSEGNNGQIYTGFTCEKIMNLPDGGMPFPIMFSQLMDPKKFLIPYPEPDVTYMPGFMVIGNTFESDDEKAPVILRGFKTGQSEDNFVFRKDGEPPKMILPISVGQKQQNGDHWVIGTCYDQDAINRNFGITDLGLYTKIMPAHRIPFYASVSCNMERTRQSEGNFGDSHKQITAYVNDFTADLRDYLLHNCIPLSYDFIKKQLCGNSGKTFIKKDNTQNLCKLNQQNQIIDGDGIKLVNGKVINASFYTGDLDDLVKEGVKWIAMDSKPVSDVERQKYAEMTPEEGDAVILNHQPFVIYAVLPFSDKEHQWYKKPSDFEESPNAEMKRERTPSPVKVTKKSKKTSKK